MTNGTGVIAIGAMTVGNSDAAVVLGTHAGQLGSGISSVAIGGSPKLQGTYNTSAIGGFSIAIGGGDGTAVPGAQAKGYRSVAIGQSSSAGNTIAADGYGKGDFGTSVGFNTHTAFTATAVGTDATAAGAGGSAFGRFADAGGKSAVALGESAVASKLRSVALGSGSTALVADTVAVGSAALKRRIMFVAPGVAGSDAVTLSQVKQIAAASAQAAMADAAAPNDAALAALRRELAELRREIAALKNERQATVTSSR